MPYPVVMFALAPCDVVEMPPRAEMEYESAFDSLIFTTNPSTSPGSTEANASEVVGKSPEAVEPTTYALPFNSKAMPSAESLLPPPRYVEYSTALAELFNFATNASVTTSDPPPNAA